MTILWERLGDLRLVVDAERTICWSDNCVTLHTSPGLECELSLGYLVSIGYPRECLRKSKAVLESENRVRVHLPPNCKPSNNCKPANRVELDKIDPKSILDILVKHSKIVKKFGLGLHTGILYNTSNKQYIVVHDVSRHSVAYKLAGITIKHNLEFNIAAITGRYDKSIVRALACAGASLLLGWRNLTVSAVREAKRIGVKIMLVRNQHVKIVGQE